MRILMVHESYATYGGEDAAASAEAALLERQGHEVIRWSVRNAEIDAWPMHRKLRLAWETTWSSSSRRTMQALLGEHRPDVVHFHNTLPIISPSAIHAAHGSGAAVALTLHNYRLLCPAGTLLRNGSVCEDCPAHSLARSVVHACYRGSRAQSATVAFMLAAHRRLGTWSRCVDAYIALTPFMRSKLLESGLPPDRVHVKHNVVALDPAPVTKPDDYALFAGRLAPEKGISTLLAALEGLRGHRLLIAGSGPLQKEVAAAASRVRGVQSLGQIPPTDALALTRRARVLVFPSVWYEGFPMTILEAIGAGVPVVASRIGGLPDILTEGADGFLVPPAEPAALAQRVVSLMEDDALHARMSAAARRTFETRFTAQKSYEQLMLIYGQAVAAARHRRAA